MHGKPAWKDNPALSISALYLALCILWILFSDRLLLRFTHDVENLTRLQTAKGWFFVLATAALLYFLIRRSDRARKATIEEASKVHEEVRRQKELLQRLVDNLPVMVTFWEGGRLGFVNRAWEKTLGWTLEEAQGCDFLAELYGDIATRRHVLDFIEAAEGGWEDFPITLRSGEILETAWACIRLSDGSILSIGQDITERKRAEAHLHFMAHHDPLTRLPNRLLLADRLQHAMEKARRGRGRVALIYLDIDRFKTINDSLGHAVGDRLLKEIAARLDREVRAADTVARLGGDEFVIVLEAVQDVERIAAIAQNFILDLAREIVVDGHRLYVTASAGISIFPEDGFDAEGLLKSAEVAMYRAKEQGKNTFRYFTPDMNEMAREILELENGLRLALERNEFVLHYQPQIDLSSGALIGVEALVRWEHPERGTVGPTDFIPLAEETGLIVPLGEWVLRTACDQSRKWRDAGFPPVRMAVNISPRQFRQSDLAPRIAAILAETGLEPDALELEVTEGMIMSDLESAIATMEQLGRMGVHLVIDDFGTGYSSLAYLKRFPISGLKIDRSFVRDVTTDISDAQIAASVIALAHSMHLRVVAEGIETEEQLFFLRSHRCDHGQGFFFSRPHPAREVADRFLKKSAG